MPQLFPASFLQALGYAIANSLWQTALIWLLYQSIAGLGRFKAAARYRLAVAAQLLSFAWFLLTVQYYYKQVMDAWRLTPGMAGNLQAVLPQGTDTSSRIIHWMVQGELLLPYVSLAYLFLLIVLCVRWMFGYRAIRDLRFQGLQKMPAEWRIFVRDLSDRLGIGRKVQVFLSEKVGSPLTLGFLKPVILVPVASINHLTTEQLEAVLLHELAHIRRFDYLVNILLSVVEIALFFNPFTQMLRKTVGKERENSCDDWVLQFQYNATDYAEALFKIATLTTAPALAMAAVGKKNELLKRIQRMVLQQDNHFSYRRQLTAFLLMTIMLSTVAWLNPLTAPAFLRKGANAKVDPGKIKVQNNTYTLEPMSLRVDNPLFNPVYYLSKPLHEEFQQKAKLAKATAELPSPQSAPEAPRQVDEAVSTGFAPLVTGALALAADAIQKEQPALEKDLQGLDMAQKELARQFAGFDTIAFGAQLKKQVADAMNLSIRKINAQAASARRDWEKAKEQQMIQLEAERKKIQAHEKSINEKITAWNKIWKQVDWAKLAPAMAESSSAASILRLPMVHEANAAEKEAPDAEQLNFAILLLQRIALEAALENTPAADSLDMPANANTNTNLRVSPEGYAYDYTLSQIPDAAQLQKLQQQSLRLAKMVVLRELNRNRVRIIPLVRKEKVKATVNIAPQPVETIAVQIQ